MKSSNAFLFLLGMLMYFPTIGQDYAPLIPNKLAYFTWGGGIDYVAKVDSMSGPNQDTWHIFQPDTLRLPYTNAARPGHWIGPELIKADSVTWLFLNKRGDVIPIKTHTHPGDSWTLYHFPGDTGMLNALHGWTLLDSIPGIGVDSVKFFQLQHADTVCVPLLIPRHLA